jgi:hypothetical protein
MVGHEIANLVNTGSIPVVASMDKVDWSSPQVRELIEKKNDGELSVLLGVSRQRVHQIRKKLGIVSASERRENLVVESGLLGKISDKELGEKLQEDPKYIAAVRQRLQIKPVRRSKFDGYVHLLGTVSDKSIAEMAGTSQSAISNYRRRRNIEPYQRRRVIEN